MYYAGNGMSYMPGAPSLATTHRGKVKNIHLSTLRDNEMTQNPKSCILNFEKEAEAHMYVTTMKSVRDNNIIVTTPTPF